MLTYFFALLLASNSIGNSNADANTVLSNLLLYLKFFFWFSCLSCYSNLLYSEAKYFDVITLAEISFPNSLFSLSSQVESPPVIWLLPEFDPKIPFIILSIFSKVEGFNVLISFFQSLFA